MPSSWTQEAMVKRLVRYDALRACRNAFVDTYSPGSDQKENFTIIGPGVAEHPDQHVHISEPHGFNIGGARQPPGCTNSQHSHQTEEVFIVQSGQWAFRWGDKCQHGEAVLGPGDCISLPTDIFRGFENIGDEVGYIFAILGGDDPGSVLWAPDVFEKAEEYGLVLLENGSLVDTTKGEEVPEGIAPMPKTTQAQIDEHRIMSLDEMLECVYRESDQHDAAESSLTAGIEGVSEKAIIGPANADENIPAGKMGWEHGFHVRRLDIAVGASLPVNARQEEEVVYLFRGELAYQWDGGELHMAEGDVLTVPKHLLHGFSNTGAEPLIAFIVRGGNKPAAPFLESTAASVEASC
ncbi:MAG: cupin domain-containing protein [Halioglobus sp.]